MAGSHVFIIQYLSFLFFLVFIFGLGAPTFITGLPDAPTPPEPPEVVEDQPWWQTIANFVGDVVYVFKYVGYFFSIMLVTATPQFGFVGLLVILPALVGLIWTILALIRGGGN